MSRIFQSAFFKLFLFSILNLNIVYTYGQVFLNDLEDSTYSSPWIGTQSIDSGYAHSGVHYSYADSAHPYSLGFESRFPEELQGTNTVLLIEGWVKSDQINDKALFVIAFNEGSKLLFWKGIDLQHFIKEEDTWFRFTDSILVPANVTKTAVIKSFLWDNDGKNKIAIDDLKIEFKSFTNPTFIPDVFSALLNEEIIYDQILFANDYYSIRYDEENDVFSVFSNAGKQLIKNIWYYNERYVDDLQQTGNVLFTLRSVKQKKRETKIQFSANHGNIKPKMEIICKTNNPEIKFVVTEKYKANQIVGRESIVIQSGQEVSEVLRSNRKSDLKDFQDEYWLSKQGARFGQLRDSWFIYHTPQISSLQLNTIENILWVNLDYKKDHPYLHFPLNNDTVDVIEDWSDSKYQKREERTYSFSIFAGVKTAPLPRFMKNPSGYLATYIWSEHADFTDIRTNRAVYFGSENITHPDKAIGGFVKYGIPVTKSVFYHNPDSITNTRASKGLFTGLESTIKSDTAFHHFLDLIHPIGYEICLHTPEEYTTTRSWLDESLDFMKLNFGSPTWIDHGNNNGLKNNREDFICDGTLEDSPYYAVDLWEQHGVKYFHNAYFEEFDSFNQWQFNNSIEKPYSGFGDMFPKPDYFKHHTRTASLLHWSTTSAFFAESEDLWNYYLGDDRLNEFVDHWGVEINHCYPAWVYPYKGFWRFDADSNIVAQEGFNAALARMAKQKKNKRLNVCTIKDFLDYQQSIEKVKYEVLPDGRIKVTNTSDDNIEGLSFATSASHVLVNDQMPLQKTDDQNIIFWFDLPVGESKLIRTIE